MTGFVPFPPGPPLPEQAATASAGFALVNATPTVISWVVPNDGQQHAVLVMASLDVTVATTGGQITVTATLPDGSNGNQQIFAGTRATGAATNVFAAIVQPGSTVTVKQNSALTAGTAVLWAAIFGV